MTRGLGGAIDRWLTAPEPNAAGRIGLFRILYSAFYLWYLSVNEAAGFSGLPAPHRHRVLLLLWLPYDLPPGVLEVLEATLVAALVLLLAGYRVGWATAAVLVIGGVLEATRVSAKADHAAVFLTFYIPFFMLLSGARWGHTYSLDALLRRRAGHPTTDPAQAGWPYYLPARACLVVLAILFFSAALFKISLGGTWLHQPEFIAHLVLEQNVAASMYRLPVNPLAPLIADSPLVYTAIRYQVLLFEGLFALGVLSSRLRPAFLAFALVFHATGALWLVVTFTPILIVYLLFIDWQALRERLPAGRLRLLEAASSRLLVGAVLSAAVMAGGLWNVMGVRELVNFGGRLDWQTIWYLVLPVALFWLSRSLIALGREALRVAQPLRPPAAPV